MALTPYWLERSQWSECRLWLEAAAGPGPLPAALRARVLNRRCYLEIWAGEAATVPGLATESLALLEGLGEPVEEGRAHGFLGLVIALGRGSDAAQLHAERSFELTRAGGDDWGLAMGLAFFANTRLLRAGPDEPRRMLDEAIEIATSAGDRRTLRPGKPTTPAPLSRPCSSRPGHCCCKVIPMPPPPPRSNAAQSGETQERAERGPRCGCRQRRRWPRPTRSAPSRC